MLIEWSDGSVFEDSLDVTDSVGIWLDGIVDWLGSTVGVMDSLDNCEAVEN